MLTLTIPEMTLRHKSDRRRLERKGLDCFTARAGEGLATGTDACARGAQHCLLRPRPIDQEACPPESLARYRGTSQLADGDLTVEVGICGAREPIRNDRKHDTGSISSP